MHTNNWHKITRTALKDKILGGWAGKAYGCMMGEPMEYRAQGEIYEGSLDIHPDAPTTWLHNEDDLYVNMALLEVVRDQGLDATMEDFARVFRHSQFMLWHANGQARQNIKAGIAPGLSGHPFYNPHADDIDFQIECDFIGLICPGLPQTASAIADRVGHLMNYGEGYYAGLFLAALYAAAFIETDPRTMIPMAMRAIPADCDYAAMLRDLLKWYEEEPENWRRTWQRLEENWNFDLCPWAKTDSGRFNIQGHFNGTYILMGLLYGKGNYIDSISICTRCGQDTDSNVGNCGGILGTLIGFENLPQTVKDELAPYMDRDYNFTTLSNNSASQLCYQLALENIESNGGRIDDETVAIATQPFVFTGKREISFIGMEFVETYKALDPAIKWHGAWNVEQARKHQAGGEVMISSATPGDYVEIAFNGTCIYMQGNLHSNYGIIDIYIDDQLIQSRDMFIESQWDNCLQSTAVWLTGLHEGQHTLKVEISANKNAASSGTEIALGRVVSYRGAVAPLPQQ
ncbi:MAG: hypothetical protein GKR89_31450 [Candidatus Latescibacteria bacterium]|nr:hypothetical protein [Candidatus Latescibacterota bacterium]